MDPVYSKIEQNSIKSEFTIYKYIKNRLGGVGIESNPNLKVPF